MNRKVCLFFLPALLVSFFLSFSAVDSEQTLAAGTAKAVIAVK